MFTVYATRSLLDRVKEPGGVPSDNTTVLGGWYATILKWSPQIALFMNEKTLLPVLVPLTPVKSLVPRFVEHFQLTCRELRISDEFIDSEVEAIDMNMWSPTASRSILGSMNNVNLVTAHILDQHAETTLVDLSVKQANLLVGPQPFYKPVNRLKSLIGTAGNSRNGSTIRSIAGYKIRVTLREIEPFIWREIIVAESVSLLELHQIIQAAFGWYNSHLFSFDIDNIEYGLDEEAMTDYKDLAVTVGGVFTDMSEGVYIYDFGDYWQHDIEVIEKIESVKKPELVGGERACPPEDSGGPWGYSELVEALQNKKHERHEELSEWVGPNGYNPEQFNKNDFDTNLETIKTGLEIY